MTPSGAGRARLAGSLWLSILGRISTIDVIERDL